VIKQRGGLEEGKQTTQIVGSCPDDGEKNFQTLSASARPVELAVHYLHTYIGMYIIHIM
jgi:hypothetical protein